MNRVPRARGGPAWRAYGLVVLVTAVSVLCPVDAVAQRQMQFFASFVDGFGYTVADVLPEELRVTEDGEPGRVVRMELVEWPMTVTILVDNGVGMLEHLVPIRNGVRGLISALPPGVEVSLLTTAPQPRWIARPTTDADALRDAVDRIAPDRGAARFVEALDEATDRMARQQGNFFPVVVILGSTTVEDPFVARRRIERMLRRLYERAATVHVVMLTTTDREVVSVGGAFQTGVGDAAARLTGGRYEALAAGSRIATLLPEIGAQIAASHARQRRQYRVTFERPPGRSGDPGRVEVAPLGELTVFLSLDGHLP